MRLRLGTLMIAVALVGGCSSNNGTAGDGGGGGDGAAGSNDLATVPVNDLGVVTTPFSVGIGPIPLAPSQEVTKCITIRLPTTVDVDVVRLQSTLAKGSHHLILYRSSATSESPTPVDCQPFEGVTAGEVPIFIAETASSVLQMPTNVSWHFTAGQMVKLEAHYINASPNAIQGLGSISLTPGTGVASSYQHADIMFCGSVVELSTQGVPANTTSFTLSPGFFGGNSNTDLTKMKVFAFTSHEHHLGSDVTVSKSTSAGDPGTQLYDNKSWDNPPLQSYDDAHLLTFGPGEGLRWQCSYDSADAVPKPTGTTTFGQHALDNEMCFIWAYYYPSVNRFISQECWQ